MATTPVLGCFLLGTRDADRLRSWYGEALGGTATDRGGLRYGDVELVFDERADLAVAAVEPGRLSLGFDVPDLRAASARIGRAGTRWTDWGSAMDPDGNVLHLVRAEHPRFSSVSVTHA